MNHKGKSHGLWMILGCLIPMLTIILLTRSGFEIGPIGRLAPFAMLLICPLMHIGMMLFMFKGNKGSCHGDNNPKGEN